MKAKMFIVALVAILSISSAPLAGVITAYARSEYQDSQVGTQSAGASISIDFSQNDSGTKSMSGMLMGVEEGTPSDDLLLPLKPRQWRIGNYRTPDSVSVNPVIRDRINRSGARMQLVLSDFWGYLGLNTTNPWPYENYPQFENYVRAVARANRSQTILWDIWNEADDTNLPFWKGTIEQFFETYRRAYQVLRQELGPDVMIGGPSFSRYDRALLTQFLDYCKANACEVNFLTWHELDDDRITTITDRLSEARSVFLENTAYASLRIREILINEIIGSTTQYDPGSILGYFYYLERGGADGACKACWNDSRASSNCYNGTLDGIVTPDTGQPRAAWWMYKTYADGTGSRVSSTTTNPQVVALGSTRSDTDSKAQVLIGRLVPDDQAPMSVSLTLSNLDSLPFIGQSQRAHIKIERIPNAGEQAVQSLDLISEKDLQLSNSSVQIILDNFALGEAYLITITPRRLGSCATINHTSKSLPPSGGSDTIALVAPVGCDWTAASNAGWITITSGASGSGNGTVSYSVVANSSLSSLTGTLAIAGQTFTVYQGAAFLDVPSNYIFYDFIGKLSARGVTSGCGGGNYCPEALVTREQMAVFIIRALGMPNPPTPTSQRFADVGPERFGYSFIEELAKRGITLGCGGGNCCPDAPVTREEMAAFLIRALGEFSPPAPASQRFLDVAATNPFYSFIDRMAQLEITLGCGGGNYCPSDNVTRGQMAAFLVRAFGL